MRKVLLGTALVTAVAVGLYSQGLPPFVPSPPGHAASRDAALPGVPAAKAQRREEAAPAVSIVTAGRAPLRETVLVAGTLVPRLEVLIAPEVEGLRVLELLVEEGDRVTKGQVMARLETETLKSQLAQNDAARAKAAAVITQAQSNIAASEARQTETANALERARPLSKSGVLSDSTLDQREAAARTAAALLKVAEDGLRVAEAERAQVEAQRRDLEWRLSRADVRAPHDGVVSRRTARIGGLASGSAVAQPMFNIIARGEIELEAEVPEVDIARLKPGLQATITVAGAGEVKGTVRLVAPEVDRATRQGRVRIALPEHVGLRIGSFGRGAVEVRSTEAVVLPASAVLFGADGAYVQLVEGGRVVVRKVAAGLHATDVVEITAGLSPGEHVVAKAGTFLRAGDLVSPVEPRIGAAKMN